jgi:hypothetical protein
LKQRRTPEHIEEEQNCRTDKSREELQNIQEMVIEKPESVGLLRGGVNQ